MRDTDQRSLFNDDDRFRSHGCSRVDNAEHLLTAHRARYSEPQALVRISPFCRAANCRPRREVTLELRISCVEAALAKPSALAHLFVAATKRPA
ncbi:hypothetical protein [Bradyrhizobium sp. ORS 111]|uniref:hypothetical protein n=1 Tax=Bradyrhizobium sp. ORS 111 TaxID=1685958 RepID=UPI00388DA903